MSRARVHREIALRALGDETAFVDLIHLGLQSFDGLRTCLFDVTRPSFTQIRLRRGYRIRLHMSIVDGHPFSTFVQLISSRTPRDQWYPSPSVTTLHGTARRLARIIGTDSDAAVRLAFGIERARRKLLVVAEEGSRWL